MAGIDRNFKFVEQLSEMYYRDEIYCLIGKVLVAMNPYKEIKGLYSDKEKRKYRIEESDKLSPHLYLIGKCILRYIIARIIIHLF